MANRVLGWAGGRVIRWLGWPALMALLLLGVALGSLAWALADVVRSLGFIFVLLLAIGGTWLGWALAAARPVPGWLAALLAVAFGLEVIVLRIGRLAGNLLAVGRALVDLAGQIWTWPTTWALDVTFLEAAVTELGTGLAALGTRWIGWLVGLITGAPVFDPVATTLVWSVAVWAVAVWAGWVVRRLNRPLLGLLPAGALLATTLAYTLEQVGAVLPLLGATLLLIGLMGHQVRERRWQRAGIDYSPDISIELAMAIVPISLALVVLAGAMPSLSVREVARAVQNLFRTEAVTTSFGLRPKPAQEEALNRVRAPGLPQSHLLGSGPELSEQVALVVTPIEPPLTPDLPGTEPLPPRYYWRSLAYDSYTGRGWRTTQTEAEDYGAGEPVLSEPDPGRLQVRQEIRLVDSGRGFVYAVGDLVTTDQDFRTHRRPPGDLFVATVAADTYQVDSLVPVVGQAELRAAGDVYPAWVQARYLTLPDTIPDRVLILARDLTATALTPYDRAKAIEGYLRTFPYTLDLPEPPSNRDMADYFLFDLQQGYCDYYATSMVVLARAAGLPARLAVGYIGGTYDPANARYLITEAEAHSWPEIYFPGYGWIKFEPTGGRPALERPAEAEVLLPPVPPPPLDGAGQGRLSVWWLILPVGLAALSLLGFGWLALDSWQLRRRSPAAAMAGLYRRLYTYGRRLAVTTATGDTPYEFATALTRRIAELSRDKRGQKLLSPAPQEIDRLIRLFVQSNYSLHPPDVPLQAQAVQTWQRLRWRLWLAWLWYIIHRRTG